MNKKNNENKLFAIFAQKRNNQKLFGSPFELRDQRQKLFLFNKLLNEKKKNKAKIV